MLRSFVLPLAAVSSLFVTSACQRKTPQIAPAVDPLVPVSKPVTRMVTEYVDFTGRANAVKAVNIVPRVTGKVTRRTPACLDEVRFAKSHTQWPVKVAVAGPMTVIDSTLDEFYGDEAALAMDIAAAVNAEKIDAFARLMNAKLSAVRHTCWDVAPRAVADDPIDFVGACGIRNNDNGGVRRKSFDALKFAL